ncbi:MarR family winged helix-turn-helix transcriptional regulator [Aquicella lusitana]|uniref:MarR family transcriptional regulator for hemolysin n=1 Tax=Aquicella lusitana TaxID=254246 RepID=A0A370GYB5_9COXI|nr:MarR family transcriptional regulator [Aquicella lusitana]RDI48647.1 MarR family transcriptional regulator for hemolysin [Aquicella lusitana]VVC73976.1 Transcriptional regulator SlyA [Aquicella lusitana]
MRRSYLLLPWASPLGEIRIVKYDLGESTSTLIKKASQLYIRLANKYLKDLGIPHAYSLFLLQLWQEDGQTQAVLHKKIGIEQPTAVRTLDRMERDLFIKRVRHSDDRREIRIFLTKKAKDLQVKAIECAKTINSLALEGFSATEKKALNKLLRNTITNLEKHLTK